MKSFSPKHFVALWLMSTLFLFLQSCDDHGVRLDKSRVQFSMDPGISSAGRTASIDLPENARLMVSITTPSGEPIYSEFEMKVVKNDLDYMAEPLDLLPGAYVITDFMIVEDSEVLNAVPKNMSQFSSLVEHSLPFRFVVNSEAANVNMQLVNARNEKPEAFGYASFKRKSANKFSFIVFKPKTGKTSLRGATAELRQGNDLIKTFPVNHGMNNIAFEGEADAEYTLSVFAGEAAKATTFNYKKLKKELGARPLKISLEPALLLTIESTVDEGNEYEEFFELVLDGTEGAVNIDWGNGFQNSYTLPLNAAHEYTSGTYTAIVTGDLDQISNLYGFSYGSVIYGIKGLTNLTELKTYNPSWGAVPVKVNLSNCKKLETIFVEKHGGPYETVDLRKEFLLPKEHFINEFVFYAPSLDPTRENISAEELELFVDNILNNTSRRSIYGGKFFVFPVDTPLPETQRKMDILQNVYNWDVRLDGNIWDDAYYSEEGRRKDDLNARREAWLRNKFPDSKHLLRSARMAYTD